MDKKKPADNRVEILSSPDQVDMADDWYQYAQLDHFWIKSRFRALLTHLSDNKLGNRLFEIGCGHGVVINQFEENFNLIVDGCDLNMHALDQINSTKGKTYCLNIFDKPKHLLESYDGILLLDVLEHIDNDVEFLQNSLEYLKEDGIIIINVPALNFLFSRYDKAAGHKRRYTKKMIKKLLSDCGITNIKTSYWGATMIPIAIIRKFVLMFVSQDKIISTGFKTPNKLSNHLLNWLLKTERKLTGSPFIGTSLIATGRVNRRTSH